MIRLLAITLLAFAVGCHAQVTPTTSYACPATTSTAYVALNTTTALTLTDTKPTAGTYCYVAQTKDASGATSGPSNTAMQAATGSNSVVLTWTAPALCSGCTSYSYIVYRAPATAVSPNAPVLGTPTMAQNQTTQETVQETVARLYPFVLRATVH